MNSIYDMKSLAIKHCYVANMKVLLNFYVGQTDVLLHALLFARSGVQLQQTDRGRSDVTRTAVRLR